MIENEYYKTLKNLNYKFNGTYGLTFITKESYELGLNMLSKLRESKEFDFDQYHTLKKILKVYYNNSIKIKNLDRLQPRKIAQNFIGKKNVRTFIFKRDNYMCLKCKSFEKKLTIDHIVSINKGGENKISNLQTLCISCNCSKSDNFKDYRNGAR